MRLRTRHCPLVLLLAPSLVVALVSTPGAEGSDGSTLRIRAAIGTKDAPVDGKDGMPHQGPFVDREEHDAKDLSSLNGRPADALSGVPETNDGVMDDPDRPKPKEGTTGTEGGVSEKEKARIALEGETGEKANKIPESPKEVPPLPHSEEERLQQQNEHDHEHATAGEVGGLEVSCRAIWPSREMGVLTLMISETGRSSPEGT